MRVSKVLTRLRTTIMFCTRAVAARPALRLYSTSTPPKPSIKLVAELRKLTEVSITKAREALSATNNDVDAAFKWLQDDLVASGAKKAAKLEGRSTQQGLVGVSVLSPGIGIGKGGVRAAMVEVNCETDFVGRNSRFDALVADIAHTAAFISEPLDAAELMQPLSLDLLRDAPLLSHTGEQSATPTTVGSAIHDSIARFGEKVDLRRAMCVVKDPLPRDLGLRVATYAHGSVGNPLQGQIGTLALLALKSQKLSELIAAQAFGEDFAKLERALARQIVGFPTTTLRSSADAKDETALYEQPFMMFPASNGVTVQTVLQRWAVERGLIESGSEEGGLEVMQFAKWTVGEPISEQ